MQCPCGHVRCPMFNTEISLWLGPSMCLNESSRPLYNILFLLRPKVKDLAFDCVSFSSGANCKERGHVLVRSFLLADEGNSNSDWVSLNIGDGFPVSVRNVFPSNNKKYATNILNKQGVNLLLYSKKPEGISSQSGRAAHRRHFEPSALLPHRSWNRAFRMARKTGKGEEQGFFYSGSWPFYPKGNIPWTLVAHNSWALIVVKLQKRLGNQGWEIQVYWVNWQCLS